MKTPTHRQSRATVLATVAFVPQGGMFTTAPAATRESWPQRIPLERDWLLAEEVAAQD